MSRYGMEYVGEHEDESQKRTEGNISNKELFNLLYPFFKPYSKKIILALTLLPLGAAAFSIQPLIIQRVIDGPLASKDINALIPFVFLFIGIVVSHYIIQITQYLLINNVGQRAVADIRYKLFDHLEKLPMSYFDKTSVGSSVTRLTNDLDNLGESFAGGMVGMAVDSINILGIAAFMIYLNWKLSLAVLFLLIPMALMANYFQNQYREANLIARKELSKLNSFLQQNIVGISVVQLLNSTKKNMRIFDENNRKFFKANDDCIKADASFSAGIEFVSITAIALLIFLSNFILVQGVLSIGIIIAFLQYAQSLFEPIRNLSDKFTIIQAGLTSAERINHLLREPISIEDPEAGEHAEGKSIEFKDVWFKYTDNWILKGLSFKIEPGEKIAFVGKTGSGKSTIIKLLSRLYEAQKGEILIDGINIKNIKQKDLRDLVSVIHQESYIFGGDVESNVTLNRPSQEIDMDLAKPFLKAFSLSLDTELSERAANISSGEEQVISFARAAASNPKILVLDEATAKIDLKTEKILQESLDEFIKDRTAIIIAHRLETIKKVDRIFVINQGRLVEEGAHEKLLNKNGEYSKLYESRLT